VAILVPQTKKFLSDKYHFNLSKGIKILSVIVLLLVSGMASSKSQDAKPLAEVKTESQSSAQPKTDQQKLEDSLKDNISKATGTTNVSYKGLEVDKADPDRPAGTKMLTISVNTSDFWSRDSFIRDTGKLSSNLFQTTFSSNIDAYDVIVWYYGKTKDRYGNEKDSIVITYSMDKDTYKKINWQNFDSSKLCDFLQGEERIVGIGSGPACNALAGIK
jgi:hypothetical protein